MDSQRKFAVATRLKEFGLRETKMLTAKLVLVVIINVVIIITAGAG
ncbi:hypothetical protein [Pseudoalteromonas xiamenensis]|uniref:Uncharacterized protein n=1 Tax=Pseudoalteromonas xiamenensis TaxID=882626 RepID=A0A975DFA7_9GAMM|nr:hypothetical protein [Pseudoalteromonas xiamenensis]QTH70713.1 hypothetical protein J5O05_12375 [Pseudoalteromonas xiamenensis]